MAYPGSDIDYDSGGTMRKPLWIVIIILALLLAFSIAYIAFYNMPSMVKEIKSLEVEVKVNKQMLRDQNFELTTSNLQLQSLRLDIVDRDLEIIELTLDGMAYGDMVSIFDYSLSYIYVMQLRMDEHGISYPEFIVERVMLEILAEGIEK